MNAIIEDVDVAPGRSRVAVVQFAAEPQVVFGFDKYFTTQSVQSNPFSLYSKGKPLTLWGLRELNIKMTKKVESSQISKKIDTYLGAISRIIYTGGPTHLSKALSFTAGVLYKEQNMADGKHRRHKLAKTPRHDRLQVGRKQLYHIGI